MKGAPWREPVDLIHSCSVLALRNRLERLWRSDAPFNPVQGIALEWGLLGALLLSPFLLRTLLLFEQSLRFAAVDVAGYLSDATVATVAAVLMTMVGAWLTPRLRAPVLVVCGVLWTLIHVGNYEHIKALGAPLQFRYAGYMRDGVFVAGSAFSLSHVVWVIVLLGTTSLNIYWALKRLRPGHSLATRMLIPLTLGYASAVWPADDHAMEWRQEHFVESVLRLVPARALRAADKQALPADFQPNVQSDLDGKLIVREHTGRPNVLLVILEGICGGSIPAIAKAHGISQPAQMSKLSSLADRYITFPTFITNQRQTNRGEFALLCGQFDYLVSGTSRMTEYARSGGPACLPQVLAEAGYRTMYIQSAPLSFMLKDQFMAKAGFTDVRGHDYFTKSYARSSWGVDDRAFFERATDAVRELNRTSPYFAAMLTVGTHHPYTVPADYQISDGAVTDPRGRAVRYLDDAVSAFVERLEQEKLLDNTLLLITSDESFGVDGYDDLTQLLSYNWGFMIAKVPGEDHRVVTAPFAQTDVALTIADYVGLSGPFIGRSLLREYASPRRQAFANTYQHKVYWSSASQIVECDEALSHCEKHTSTSPGIFGNGRNSVTADEVDISPLREMVARTSRAEDRRLQGRLPLIRENAAVWNISPDSKGLLFGGQYFTLQPDQEVVVSLEATLVGKGLSTTLDSDLYARGMLYEMLPPRLYDGDTLRFQYVYAPGVVQDNLEIRLGANGTDGSGRIILKRAEMNVRPRSAEKDGVKPLEMTIERGSSVQAYFLGSGFSQRNEQRFVRHDCVTQSRRKQYMARSCPRAVVLSGPSVEAPAQARVRARFELMGDKGSETVHAELVSSEGSVQHARSNALTLAGKARNVLTLDYAAPYALHGVEARLFVDEDSEDSAFVIRRAVLEVLPAAPRAP